VGFFIYSRFNATIYPLVIFPFIRSFSPEMSNHLDKSLPFGDTVIPSYVYASAIIFLASFAEINSLIFKFFEIIS